MTRYLSVSVLCLFASICQASLANAAVTCHVRETLIGQPSSLTEYDITNAQNTTNAKYGTTDFTATYFSLPPEVGGGSGIQVKFHDSVSGVSALSIFTNSEASFQTKTSAFMVESCTNN